MKKTITLITLFLTTIAYAQLPNYIPSNGLVGYWPFSGNANDESPNGNNGTIQGATLTTDRFNQTNRAYNFNGDDTILVVNPSKLPYGRCSFTTSVWVNTTVWFNRGNIIGWGASGVGSQCNYIMIDELGGITHYFWTNDITDTTANLANSWHNIILTYDSATSLRSVYLDGVFRKSAVATIPNVINSNISIGVQQAAPGFFCNSCGFTGAIDDIGIWNRVLTQQEITNLYTVTATTSIVENSMEAKLSIYPNPATNQLFIETNDTPVTEINIYNTTGSLVMSVVGSSMVNGQLSIVNLANGIYIAEVKTKDASVKKRWVKM